MRLRLDLFFVLGLLALASGIFTAVVEIPTGQFLGASAIFGVTLT